jgi:hypothetical protein
MNHPLAALFEQFLRERTYLKNVTTADACLVSRCVPKSREQRVDLVHARQYRFWDDGALRIWSVCHLFWIPRLFIC